MVQDVVRQGISPATGPDIGNQAVVDYNLKADGAFNIPHGDTNTLNGAKDEDGYIRLTNGDLYFYAGGVWKKVGGNPATFLPITLEAGQQEVTVTWSDHAALHGTRPVYIDLYEVTLTGTVQTTSRVFSTDFGVTYKWNVGSSSARMYEVRILGYTTADQPTPPTPSLGFPFTFPFTLS